MGRSARKVPVAAAMPPRALVVIDGRGNIVQSNTQADDLLGHHPGSLVGAPMARLVPSVTWVDLPALAARSHPVDAVRTDGTTLTVSLTVEPLGEPPTLAVVTIAPRGRSARSASRPQRDLPDTVDQRLALAVRVAHLGFWECDADTLQLTASQALEDILALPPVGDITTLGALLAALPGGAHGEASMLIADAVTRRAPFEVEHRVASAGGERVVLHRGEPIDDLVGAARMVAIALDVTGLKATEQKLFDAVDELKTVFEICPVGLTIIRDGGASLERNAVSREMLETSVYDAASAAALARRVHSPSGGKMPRDELPGVRAMRGESVSCVEVVLERLDGTRVPLEVSAKPVMRRDGTIAAVVGTWRDTSAEKELARLRAEWNSIVAHDLRQPINGINLFAQVLARSRIDWSPQAREAIVEIKHMVQRLSRMTLDLLDISRLDAGRLQIERKVVDLAPLVQGCIDRARLDAPERPIKATLPGELSPFMADPARLEQVLDNLISNATKYGAEGTPIDVVVAATESGARISVTNEGEGIERHEVEQLFERFKRSRSAQASRIVGVGLGLAITRGLVEAHGGSISVESEPGRLTTFSFTLPRRD